MLKLEFCSTPRISLSDNAYYFGSHGLANKITMQEESVRVPIFAIGVGIPKDRKTSSLVSSLDLYPTIKELSGSSLPAERIRGKYLLALFENPKAYHRNIIFPECVGVVANVVNEPA